MSNLSWRVTGDFEPFCSQEGFKNAGIEAFAKGIFERDDFTCRSCQFRTRPSKQVFSGYFEICPLSRDYDNRDPDNWISLCPFCHAAQTMKYAINTGDYYLIAAPWITQRELATIIKPLLVLLSDAEHYFYAESVHIYDRLFSGQAALSSLIPVIPSKKDNETIEQHIRRFIELLDSTATDEHYEQREKFTGALRVLPKRDKFTSAVKYWNAAVFKKYPLSKWERLIEWKQEQKSG